MNLNIRKISEEIFPSVTKEMVILFKKRTNYHISLVQKYCDKISKIDSRFSKLNADKHDQPALQSSVSNYLGAWQ